MSKKIRIGNDIEISWRILNDTGPNFSLNTSSVSVWLCVGSKSFKVENFTLADNLISFVFYGSTQLYTGMYVLKLCDGNSSLTYDTINAFILVDHSWQSSDLVTTNTEVNITSVLDISHVVTIKGEPGNEGAPGQQGEQGIQGLPGVGISSVQGEYYQSSSSSSLVGGEWSTTAPAWLNGTYVWQRLKIIFTDESVSYTAAVNITGEKGNTGSSGSTADITHFLDNLTYDSQTNTWTLAGNFATTLGLTAGTASTSS